MEEAQGDEMEEGEVTEDGELSDISDDASLEEGEISEEEEEAEEAENPTKDRGESHAPYDRSRYYNRRGSDVRPSSSELVLESPASPEMAEQRGESRREVPTIPMEKEPRLPPELEERGGWVQVSGPPQEQEQQQEEEDLDEDLLYLRLIALRSLATEKEEEEKREKEAEGKAEMLELLEEAKTDNPAAAEVITIDDDDDDPISEMKLHLHESYIATGFQKSIEVVDVLDSPSYSPTQSLDPLSPIYLPPDFSPPDSPSDCQVVEASPPPQPPPLPPPSLPPPPPPPPISIYPEPVPCLRAEPLPPGEDTAPEISYCLPPQAPLDMDLDSGDEAESQFFRKQRIEKEECIFPESVWGFGGPKASEKSPPGRKRKEMEEKKEGEELRRSKRRKRKSSSRDKENQKRAEKAKEVPSLEDDEEALRAILLAQVSKAQTKKPIQDPVKEIQSAEKNKPGAVKEAVKEVVKEDASKATNSSVLPGSKAETEVAMAAQKASPKSLILDPPPLVKPAPALSKPTTAPTPLPPPQTKPVVKAAKVTPVLKVGKPGKVSRRPSNSSLSNKSMPTLSKAEREKHFPNLSRKIIIPNVGDNTDSEEEDETLPVPQPSKLGGSTSSMFGGLNLEAFLKEARNTAAPPSSQSNSIKPAQPRKKLMMTPKLKAQAQKLTLADKKKLISSKISHLSRSTQIEYQRLKEILAKKEREKVLAKKDGVQKKSGDPRVGKNSPKSTTALNLGSPKCVTPEMALPEISSGGDEPLQVLNGTEDTTEKENAKKLESKPPPTEDSQSVKSLAAPQDTVEKSVRAPQDNISVEHSVPESTAGTGRQRQESEEDEAALRLNLIESMKKSVAEKKSSSKEFEEKKHASEETLSKRPKSKERPVPSRRVVHSKHLPSKRDESVGNKTVKDSNGVLDQVTVKISCENKARIRNVEVRSGSGGPMDKRSREDGEKKINPKKDAITGAGDKKEEKEKDECEKKDGSFSEIEQGVVEGRKALSESLFKLSAFMSQLQKKSIDLDSGRRYAEELRKQLKETEDLVRVREGNVEKLRESIKHQHQQIVLERSALVKLEETCKSKGVAVPEEGAENIQKKLAQIKNTAMKVKTSQSTEVREEANRNDFTKKEKSNLMGPPSEAVKTVAEAGSELIRDELSKLKTGLLETKNNPSSLACVAGSANSGVGSVAEQVGSSRESVGGDYASPLAHLRSTASTLDPNRTLCRFQLSGKCLDPACPDQHTAD